MRALADYDAALGTDGRGGVMAAKTAPRDVTAHLAFLCRALKAPSLRESVNPARGAGPRGGLDA